MSHALRLLAGLAALALVATASALTSPAQHFGFAIGDDYQLATYTQTEAYFKKLAAESDRTRLVDIGRTEEGRTQWMMVISDPANIKRLDHYKSIATRLARAEGLTDEQAATLAAEGKAVVWIDGGLHASETVGTHQLIETIWMLASAQDAEIKRILKDTIILCAHANPDGQEIVSSWYMREPKPENRVLTTTPRLYQKYVGHDNNRDFFMGAMRESANINRQLFLEWFPQIVYNHHQTGPAGTVIFVPPFRDPFNHVYDPLVVAGIDSLGNAIQTRFLQEGKPGATSRSGANYSTWFNGGLRTICYFHNSIGLLSEIIGNPTPARIPLIARRQLPTNDLMSPVAPQVWHFRQSIDYSLSANRAVLDYASRHRETLLLNIYRMGRNSIARGRTDHWTPRPARIDEISRLAAADRTGTEEEDASEYEGPRTGQPRLATRYYDVLHQAGWRDPRGFILPSDQPDFPTAVKFINALVKNGIAVHRATAAFTVAGKMYPAGSYIVKADQAFRPHILDMFEPQDHPNDFKYEGGPPNRPYDVTGWTLAFQMGVQFDRVLEGFDGPFERLPWGQLQTPPARPAPAANVGVIASHRANDTFILANRLLKAGAEAYWLPTAPTDAPAFGPGALYVPDSAAARPVLARAARELGLDLRPVAAPPTGQKIRVAAARIALWDRFGGSMPSGWTRWILEQFEFPFELIYPAQIDAGQLRAKYDVIILVSGAVTAPGGPRPMAINRPKNVPDAYAGWFGRFTPEKSLVPLRSFLEEGGTIVALGGSSSLAYHLGLPLRNGLTETGDDGKTRALSDEKFYVPGSILEARLDPNHPLAWGMPERAMVYFERSAAFTLEPNAPIERVAWYDSDHPLRSGWAWGQQHLKDKTAIAVAPVGRGRLCIVGNEIAFRGQTHGTLKMLFNAFQLGAVAESGRN